MGKKIHFLLFVVIVISFKSAIAQNIYCDTIQANNKSKATISQQVNNIFTSIVDKLGTFLFFDPFEKLGLYNPEIKHDGKTVLDKNGTPVKRKIPFVVAWLILGAVFFTIYFGFINIRGIKLAIKIVTGRFWLPNQKGQVSHFKTLTTALSATVGLGNIAGVAIAISLGGPGATFWMIVAGFLGMSTKFAECTLAVKYRKIDNNGKVSGGPMYYLKKGFEQRGMKTTGVFLSVLFAILVVFGAMGIGNMFQVNQAFAQVAYVFPVLSGYGFWFGAIIAAITGIIIIGGIKSIANVTSKIVPFMAALYIIMALYVILSNIDKTGTALSLIWDGAFNSSAVKGGVLGVLIIGFQRSAFSNEAGIGSAPIAHSVAQTNEPVSEGLVALLEPFVDTIIICTITALVLIFTGFYSNTGELKGAELTSAAFESSAGWFRYLLLATVILFAFSTIIAWSYYGLKGFDYLAGSFFEKKFGSRLISDRIYQFMFLVFTIIGASSGLGAVIDFSDMLILTMALPNIFGLIIMAPEIKHDLKCYLNKIKSGEIKQYK